MKVKLIGKSLGKSAVEEFGCDVGSVVDCGVRANGNEYYLVELDNKVRVQVDKDWCEEISN